MDISLPKYLSPVFNYSTYIYSIFIYKINKARTTYLYFNYYLWLTNKHKYLNFKSTFLYLDIIILGKGKEFNGPESKNKIDSKQIEVTILLIILFLTEITKNCQNSRLI